MVSESRELSIARESRAARGIGSLAWLLLAAAGIHFVVHLLLRAGPASYGFPPEPSAMLFAVRAAAPFGVAAAVVMGAGNWSRGRQWLMLGATALALRGVLELVGEGTLYWVMQVEPSGAPARAAAIESVNYARAFVSVSAAALAPILLAIGLWRGAHDRPAPGASRRWLVGLVGLIALVALGAGLWLALEVVRRTPEVWFGAIWEVLLAMEAGAMGVLALAALRGVGSRAPLPEALIAAGSTLVAMGLGWSSAALLSALFDAPGSTSILRSYPLPTLLTALGWIVIAVGFASGRLVPPAEE